MYYSLYKFGRHWKAPRAEPVKLGDETVARAEEIRRATPVDPNEINEARDWIRNTDPNLDQIDQRANTEGH